MVDPARTLEPLWAVPPPPRPSLPVAGRATLFPVRRVYCVGRNYAAHAAEMGGDPVREPPFFFAKPPDAAFRPDAPLPFPPATRELHHEVELVVALGAAVPADAEDPLEGVFGFAVGVDLTRRDLQREARERGRPWDMAKGFDRSAPCSAVRPREPGDRAARGAIRLWVNGELRQSSDLSEMAWGVPELLQRLAGLVELAGGDLVMTGTPEGVGVLRPGDSVRAEIEGLGELAFGFVP